MDYEEARTCVRLAIASKLVAEYHDLGVLERKPSRSTAELMDLSPSGNT
jgi:hypothetical protein